MKAPGGQGFLPAELLAPGAMPAYIKYSLKYLFDEWISDQGQKQGDQLRSYCNNPDKRWWWLKAESGWWRVAGPWKHLKAESKESVDGCRPKMTLRFLAWVQEWFGERMNCQLVRLKEGEKRVGEDIRSSALAVLHVKWLLDIQVGMLRNTWFWKPFLLLDGLFSWMLFWKEICFLYLNWRIIDL